MEGAVNGPGRVEVFADPDALADAAAAIVAERLRQGIAERGRVLLALSGGGTPRGAYGRLAASGGIDWTRVHIVWGDERCVPPGHETSNYRMAREVLLDRVPIPADRVHRIRGEAPPRAEAARYDAELRTLVGDGALDLALLGLGTDGHTASLFPDAPVPPDDGAWVRAVSFADARGQRITVTEAPLVAARTLLFLVAGADKAPAMAAVFGAAGGGASLPARGIATRAADVRWLVDAAAAAAITPSRA